MTGPELRAALDEIGMSQREFASRFGLDETSISRWMHAKRAVPSWVPPALDLIKERSPMTYTVSTITQEDDKPTSNTIGTFPDKAKAMQIAKREAPGAKDCVIYGPTSLAYVGRKITAVVSW